MDTSTKKVLRSSSFIVVAGLLGKILALIKETLMASNLGSGAQVDTYVTAIVAATLLTDVVGSGISSCLLPILSEIEMIRGKKHKLNYINNLLHITILTALMFIILNWLLLPLVLRILVRGIEGDSLKSMSSLVTLGLPMGLFIMIRSIFITFLHSEHSSSTESKSWLYYYTTYIIFLIFFSHYGIHGLMVTGTIATIIQLCSILPTSISKGYKYEGILNFRDDYFKKFVFISIPVIISTLINTINVMIDKSFASTLVTGSKSWLNYSDAIIQFVLGIFVIEIITALLPTLPQDVSDKTIGSLKNLTNLGSNLILSIIIPITIILISLSQPIVKLLFERGKFAATDTIMTSQLLIYYALGLISTSIILLLINYHYSAHSPITPIKFGLVGVLVNFILNSLLVKYMAVNGLALATSISSTLIMILLIRDINKNFQVVNMQNVRKILVKLIPITIAMVVLMLGSYRVLGLIPLQNKIINVLQLLVAIVLGVFAYSTLRTKLKLKL